VKIRKVAVGLIRDEGERVLLVHRNTPERSQWELPGGKVEPGEASEQALERELREELGVASTVVSQVGQCVFYEGGYAICGEWFTIRVNKGYPTIRETKFDAIRFVGCDEVSSIWNELSPNARNVFRFLKDKS
jgi:8-oxo-dGTP diphosphatase